MSTRPPLPEKTAEFLAHRHADMEEAGPRTKAHAVARGRFQGACEVIATLDLAHHHVDVWAAVMEAYEQHAPRPDKKIAPRAHEDWTATMTQAVIEEVRKIQ